MPKLAEILEALKAGTEFYKERLDDLEAAVEKGGRDPDRVEPPKSEAQAKFFGAIAGGTLTVKGISAADAKKALKGTDVSDLPKKAGS